MTQTNEANEINLNVTLDPLQMIVLDVIHGIQPGGPLYEESDEGKKLSGYAYLGVEKLVEQYDAMYDETKHPYELFVEYREKYGNY